MEPTLGSQYLRARSMHPASGRFLTGDTWSVENERPSSKNLYNYGEVDPIRYQDRSGQVIVARDVLARILLQGIWGPLIATEQPSM